MSYRSAVCRRVDHLSGERCKALAFRITDPSAPSPAGWRCLRGHIELESDFDWVLDTAVDEEEMEGGRLMRLTPNRNGTARQELIDQRIEVCQAITELLRALQEAYPNGRDYQLSAEEDIREWGAFLFALRSFKLKLEEEAYALSQMEDKP